MREELDPPRPSGRRENGENPRWIEGYGQVDSRITPIETNRGVPLLRAVMQLLCSESREGSSLEIVSPLPLPPPIAGRVPMRDVEAAVIIIKIKRRSCD